MRAEKVFKDIMLKNNETLGKIISIPSEISAGCGMSWESEILFKDKLIEALKSNDIEYDSCYEINK